MTRIGLAGLLLACVAGCGTTRWSDTSRTATEQMLLSSAIDQSVNNIDFSPLTNKDVYFDGQFLAGATDERYVASSLRQHLLSYGVHLKEDREEATYVVEARAGVVGTDRHDVMLGIPALNLPPVIPVPGVPTAIPEVPFAKSTSQRGVSKISVFAFNQKTGRAVWQSGAFPVVSTAKDSWLLGAGPFQRGTVYDGTRFAGSRMIFSKAKEEPELARPEIPVTAEAVFDERPAIATGPSGTLSATPAEPAPTQDGSAGEVVHAVAIDEATPSTEAAATATDVPRGGASAGDASVPPTPVTSPVGEGATTSQPGRLVRLPPLDQQARPDLVPLENSPDKGRDAAPAAAGTPPKRTTRGVEPDEEDEREASELPRFNLFWPPTWFGGW